MSTATKQTSKLDSIAANMRQRITGAGAPWSHQRLAHGLELVLQRRLEPTGVTRWRLALGREAVQPSDDEVAICRRAFGVPDAADPTRRQAVRTNSKTNKHSTWNIAELEWIEQ